MKLKYLPSDLTPRCSRNSGYQCSLKAQIALKIIDRTTNTYCQWQGSVTNSTLHFLLRTDCHYQLTLVFHLFNLRKFIKTLAFLVCTSASISFWIEVRGEKMKTAFYINIDHSCYFDSIILHGSYNEFHFLLNQGLVIYSRITEYLSVLFHNLSLMSIIVSITQFWWGKKEYFKMYLFFE